jgi:hypothetical protein
VQDSKNKICIRFSGGLGNQLFQFGAALNLSKLLNSKEIFLDLRYLDKYETPRSFELDFLLKNISGVEMLSSQMQLEQFASKLRIAKIVDGKILDYAFLSSVNSLLKLGAIGAQKKYKSVLLDGYFQDPQVLDIVGLREIYDKVISDERRALLETVNQRSSANGAALVGVHIRRGDFQHQKAASKRFQLIDLEYYLQAAKLFPSNVRFLIFSDDPKVCSELSARINGFNVACLGLTTQQEFVLLSSCESFIIANSTFSWWASTLGHKRESTVVAPKVWYRNNAENKINQLLLNHYKYIN